MEKKKAMIWDLDGTLLDSYDEIISSVILTLEDYGLMGDLKEIRKYIIRYSVKKYFMKIEEKTGISFMELHDHFEKYHHAKYLEVTAMPHAMEILQYLKEHGIPSFVFTHRTFSTLPILENLKMLPYFEEVLTIGEDFPRKPNPQAIQYLLDKYSLDPGRTWYVGDRKLDMECGKNAGIKTILYLSSKDNGVISGQEDHVITDLMDIAEISSQKDSDKTIS